MFIKRKKHRRPVASFQYLVEQNTFLGGQDFCFYYMFKTNFSGRNNIWGGTKEIWGNAPLPVATGLKLRIRSRSSFIFTTDQQRWSLLFCLDLNGDSVCVFKWLLLSCG